MLQSLYLKSLLLSYQSQISHAVWIRSNVLIILSLLAFLSKAQIPGGILDLNEYWQLSMESISNNDGSRIQLSNQGSSAFLRLGTSHDKLDLMHPFFSWPFEQSLIFSQEDEISLNYKEQMRITKNGDVRVDNLKGSITRNLVALPDGTIRPQDFSGHAGILSLSAHDFVSFGNPGDDHNINNLGRIVHHESQLASVLEILVAPVQLPQGAIIREINVYYKDGNNSDTMEVYLAVFNHSSPLTPAKYEVGKSNDTGGISNTWYSPSLISNNFNLKVDNAMYFYQIYAHGTSTFNWPGDQVGISSANIIYDLSEN